MMMQSKDPLKKDVESKKFTDVKLFAEKFNKYLDSLIKQGKLNLVAKKSLAMLMNPTTLFKAMEDDNLQTMIPLGLMKSLDKYKQQQSEAEAAALAAPAPVADAPATTAGFKEWFNRF
jgi:polyhydroxyalkanoate synthesis regulator phasin